MFGSPNADICVKTFAILDNRRQQKQIAPLFHVLSQTAANLVSRLRLDRALALRAILRAEPGKEQAHEMINFRDRRHRAFAPAARLALLNADGGGNAGDQIDFGPGQLLDELTGIDIHRIQETPLPLGKKKIKRQCALPRTAHPGDDDELIARNGQGNILEIVLARAMNGDDFLLDCRC